MISLLFTSFPAGISLWDEHPPFMAPLLAQLPPSRCDPWGSGGKAGAGMDCRVNRLFPLVYPLPSHATAVTVSALCSSTSTAGRWACSDGLLPRQCHCAGMQWPSSWGGHQGYWGRVGTPTLEQEGLEWLLRSKLQETWRKRR